MIVDKENAILSEAMIEEWSGGVPVNWQEVNEQGVEMVHQEVGPVLKQLLEIEKLEGTSMPAGYILSSDRTKGVSIRYAVLHVDGDQNIARTSPDGIVFFRNKDGGYTYFFVENFVLQYLH